LVKDGIPLLELHPDSLNDLSTKAIGAVESWLFKQSNKGDGTFRVTVGIRVRPALNRKIVRLGDVFHSCIGCSHKSTKIYITLSNKPVLINADGEPMGDAAQILQFKFDHIFPQSTKTDHIYASCCNKSVQDLLSGRNITLIAYGQTSSGKTYTLLGNKKDPGLAVLFARDLLSYFRTDMSRIESEISISYCQVYKRNVTDLLTVTEEDLDLITNKKIKTVEVDGLSRHSVQDEVDVRRLIEKGAKNRMLATERLNTTHSQSHTILTFRVLVRNQGVLEGDGDFSNVAKLNIVDLAGSEALKISSQNCVEATNMNLSLANLALVVKALNEKKLPPYQNTVLTELLSDALGGNCKTTLIATISPAQWNARESLNTLNFAAACSKVENTVKRNYQLESRLEMAIKMEKKEKPILIKKLAPWKDFKCIPRRIKIENIHGSLSCLAYGDTKNPIILCLHGRTSDAEGCYGK